MLVSRVTPPATNSPLPSTTYWDNSLFRYMTCHLQFNNQSRIKIRGKYIKQYLSYVLLLKPEGKILGFRAASFPSLPPLLPSPLPAPPAYLPIYHNKFITQQPAISTAFNFLPSLPTDFSFPATVTAEAAAAAELQAAGGGTERQRRQGLGDRWHSRRRSALHVIAPAGRSEGRLPAGAERGAEGRDSSKDALDFTKGSIGEEEE